MHPLKIVLLIPVTFRNSNKYQPNNTESNSSPTTNNFTGRSRSCLNLFLRRAFTPNAIKDIDAKNPSNSTVKEKKILLSSVVTGSTIFANKHSRRALALMQHADYLLHIYLTIQFLTLSQIHSYVLLIPDFKLCAGFHPVADSIFSLNEFLPLTPVGPST